VGSRAERRQKVAIRLTIVFAKPSVSGPDSTSVVRGRRGLRGDRQDAAGDRLRQL